MNADTHDLLPEREVTLETTNPAPDGQPSMVHKIFVGKDGIRAGWSLLIFIALVAAFLFAARVIGQKIHPTSKTANAVTEMTVTDTLIDEAVPFLVVLLVTWIMSKIERRPNSVYGLGGRRKLSLFFSGLGWGVACLSLLVLTLWKSGLLVIDSRLLAGSDIVRYGAVWLIGFLLVALTEEYLTRGYLQFTLARGFSGVYRSLFKTPHSQVLGFWTAAIFFSVLFGLGHSGNPGESPIGLLSAGLAGLVFCFSLWRTGSLWWAIGFHTSWDWAQSFLYGVADSGIMVQHRMLATHSVGKPILSGGTTGPEGSIFIVAILALISVLILVTLRPVRRAPVTDGLI